MTTEATPEATPSNGAPRISLADIESEISHVAYMNGGGFFKCADHVDHVTKILPVPGSLEVMTICMMILKNGFMVIGQAAPASLENYDQAHGRKLAYDKCIAQLFPILGYVLKEQLHRSA